MSAESMRDQQLLHACVIALEHLLESPDLQLNCLEQPTRDAALYARSVLRNLKARLQEVYCVLCGELLPNEAFTDQARGQLVAYAHQACADRASQPANIPKPEH